MSHRILVADDNEQVRSVIRRSLEFAGYSVREVANGEEAVRALHATAFDLVITDILMPEKDGLETIMYLRRENPGTKVIAISGAANELFLTDARGLGAVSVLAKPFTPDDLLRLVRSVLSPRPVPAGSDPPPGPP